MANPYTYISKAELEAYLGVTLTAPGIAQFNLMLPAMMDMVDQYTNRTWNFTNPLTENFDALQEVTAPYATDAFFTAAHKIDQTPYNVAYPLAKGVRSVTIGGIVWDMHFVYSYDTYIKLWVRPMTIMLPNPLGFKSVQVVYNAEGAQTCPPAVKLALCQWIARLIQTSADSGKEVNKVQAGTVIAQYNVDKLSGMPDFVKLVLDNYRFVPIDHL